MLWGGSMDFTKGGVLQGMSGRCDDIIHLPHHVSAKRKRMSMIDRAAQFSPFAALTGFETAIRESGRLVDRQIDFDVDGTAMLDEKLRLLAEHLAQQPKVTVTYFVPDERKSGGAYVNATGRVRKIDPWNTTIQMEDGTSITFAQIYDIDADVFA